MIQQALQEVPITSELAAVEIRAAIWKRRHDGTIDDTERDALLSAADTLLFSAISMLSLSSDVVTEASGLVARFPVRTLDALHLASALIAQRHARRHGRKFQFCTADRRQHTAAGELFGAEGVIFVPPWR